MTVPAAEGAVEAQYTTTLKVPGRDEPWIVIRSTNAAQLQDQLKELQHGGVFAELAHTQAALRSVFASGSILGARSVTPQPSGAESGKGEHQEAAAAAAQRPAGPAPTPQQQPRAPQQAPAGQEAPQQAPTARPEPAQLAAQPPQGHQQAPGLAAQSLQGYQQAQPAAAPAPQQPQAPQPAGLTPQQPSVVPQAMAQPPQQGGTFSPPPPMPGAPIILGQPARFHSGTSSRGPWQAFFDPRPQEEIEKIPVGPDGKVPETDDPNHPGLAGGTHRFAMFLR